MTQRGFASEARATGSPLHGRYLVKNRVWNAYLRGCDALLGALGPRQTAAGQPASAPRRVLLAIGGHIGDSVIATASLALLKRERPELEVGIVAASWAKPVFEHHPLVARMHVVDHWKLDRSARPLSEKLLRHRRTLATALAEIRALHYDVAVDLYAYYPNMAWLLWRAGISTRIGYRSGGYGPLYTHALEWSNTTDHTAVQQARLMTLAFPEIDPARATSYVLGPVRDDSARRAEARLIEAGVSPGEYVVVHMGVGSALREWPRAKWRETVRALVVAGHQVVLTGAGDDQVRDAADVARECGCATLAGRLSWNEFVHIIANARVVVAPETVAGHVAAAVGTPCVSLYTGMGTIDHWRPLSSVCSVLTHDVPCAPCHRRRGCATMDCVRDIEVDDVLAAVQAAFASPELASLRRGGT